LSVRLGDIPADHREMVAFWTEYWRRNRDILLDGAFEPQSPLANYPMITAYDGRKRIVASYQEIVVALDDDDAVDAIDVVNAKASGRVVIVVEQDLGSYRFTVSDARGRPVESGTVTLGAGGHVFTVPPSGLLALER